MDWVGPGFPWLQMGHCEAVLGNSADNYLSRLLSVLSQGQACGQALLMSKFQVSPVFLPDPANPQPAKRACLLHVEPQDWDIQSVSWPAHSPGWVSAISLFLGLLSGAQGLTRSLFFYFHPVTCISFLKTWSYRSPSAGFQFVFRKNYSVYIDVFLMCSWGYVNPIPSYFAILISSHWRLFFLHVYLFPFSVVNPHLSTHYIHIFLQQFFSVFIRQAVLKFFC